jgi:ABC-type uncharacterized transport system auxiliary subunit
MRWGKVLIGFLLILLVLPGCTRKTVERKYYLIEPPEILPSDTTAIPPKFREKFCVILPARISPQYNKHRIAVRTGEKELSYYVYHQWAVAPREAFTRFVELEVQNAHLFQRAGTEVWKYNPEFQISLDVSYLEVQMDGEKAIAHLAARLDLIRQFDQQPVVSHHFDRFQPLPRRNLNLFAVTVSRMFHEELNLFIQKMRDWASEPEK